MKVLSGTNWGVSIFRIIKVIFLLQVNLLHRYCGLSRWFGSLDWQDDGLTGKMKEVKVHGLRTEAGIKNIGDHNPRSTRLFLQKSRDELDRNLMGSCSSPKFV